MFKISKFCKEYSSCQFRNFFNRDMLRLNNGRDNLAAFVCQNIAKGLGDFTDDPVGAEQAQAMSDACREAPLGLEVMLTRKEVVSNVPVAKPLDVKLSPADRFQELGIVLGPGAKRAKSLTLPLGGAANRLNQMSQGVVYLNRSEGVQVPFVGGLRELGSAMEVRNSFAHSLPGRGALGVVFFGSVHFKVPGVVQGSLNA